mmetsp:Transcript_10721/g.36409  ORF Transcript_10721/g.36409 Transcript_10721/m.36409 type:complete len:203 (+) Transcript_10721:798-1406(+)
MPSSLGEKSSTISGTASAPTSAMSHPHVEHAHSTLATVVGRRACRACRAAKANMGRDITRTFAKDHTRMPKSSSCAARASVSSAAARKTPTSGVRSEHASAQTHRAMCSISNPRKPSQQRRASMASKRPGANARVRVTAQATRERFCESLVLATLSHHASHAASSPEASSARPRALAVMPMEISSISRTRAAAAASSSGKGT